MEGNRVFRRAEAGSGSLGIVCYAYLFLPE